MIKELTEKNIERLDDILFDMGDKVMDLESVDGFFCALACSPERIAPSDYLPVIFGGEIEFSDESLLNETMPLLFSYWNAVVDKLRKPVQKPDDLYFPFSLKDSEGDDVDGRLWALGFMIGVSAFPDPWEKLMEDKNKAQQLTPMMIFAGQNQENPELKAEPIPEDKHAELLATMFFCLYETYEFFREEREKASHKKGFSKDTVDIFQSPATSLNIGRNDPCHCGSGTKFKKCCLSKEQGMIH